MERYNFKSIENKWQKIWEKNKSFSSKINKNKKKFYCLEMFPYPSGKFIWDMFVIIQSEMYWRDIKNLWVIMSCTQWDGILWDASRKCTSKTISTQKIGLKLISM